MDDKEQQLAHQQAPEAPPAQAAQSPPAEHTEDACAEVQAPGPQASAEESTETVQQSGAHDKQQQPTHQQASEPPQAAQAAQSPPAVRIEYPSSVPEQRTPQASAATQHCPKSLIFSGVEWQTSEVSALKKLFKAVQPEADENLVFDTVDPFAEAKAKQQQVEALSEETATAVAHSPEPATTACEASALNSSGTDNIATQNCFVLRLPGECLQHLFSKSYQANNKSIILSWKHKLLSGTTIGLMES